MTLDRDLREIVQDEIDDPHERELVTKILEWENPRVHHGTRQDKKRHMDNFINEYLNDRD